MDIKGLEKTYGVRIPVSEHADYYINTLLKSKEKNNMLKELEAFDKFEKSLGEEEMKSFKHKLIEKSVSYLKEVISEKVNSWIPPEHFVLETNEFKPEHDKCYISFDVKQANWTVTKYFLGLDFPIWEKYAQSVLEFPEALAYSKPLRQAILGQVVNPKRYDSMQKYLTWKHLNELKKIPEKMAKIVSVNSEEIILEISKGDISLIEYVNSGSLNWIVPVKFTIFETKIHKNYGDNVIVKEFLNEDFSLNYKSLYGVNGHRFYIHFKTLVLEEVLDERDTLFRLESKTFQWCGLDLKDYREWGYVEKWIKPLMWGNDDKLAYSDNQKDLYYIMDVTDLEVTLFDLKEKEEIILSCNDYDYKKVVSNYHYDKIRKFFN